MKLTLPALLTLTLLLSGCARQWTITRTDGTTITAIGKPKLKGGVYTFKDASGQPDMLQVGRVREIAPASMQKEKKDYFLP